MGHLYDFRAMAWLYGVMSVSEGYEVLESTWNALTLDGLVDDTTESTGLQVSKTGDPKTLRSRDSH